MYNMIMIELAILYFHDKIHSICKTVCKCSSSSSRCNDSTFEQCVEKSCTCMNTCGHKHFQFLGKQV